MDVAIGRAVLTSLGTAGICSAAEPLVRAPSLPEQPQRSRAFYSGELAGASRERCYPGRIPPELVVAMEAPLKSGNS